MKKILILVAAFLCAYQFSSAQTEKGNQTLGVNLGFGYNKYSFFNTSDQSSTNTSSKVTTFNIGPSYSYFIADKLDLGASLSYQALTNNINNDAGGAPYTNGPNKQTNNNFEGTIYLRKYFLYANKIGVRTGPYVGYSRNDQKSAWADPNTGNNSNSVTNGYEAGAKLDLVYYPSTHLGVTATLANLEYQHYTVKNDYATNSEKQNGNSVNLSLINNGLTVGVFYVFGNK